MNIYLQPFRSFSIRSFSAAILFSVMLFSCKEAAKKQAFAEPIPELKETRLDTKYFNELIKQVKPLVPKAYHLAVNEEEQYFTVTIDHYKICTLDNLAGKKRSKDGVSIIDYDLKKENVSEITYIMRYSFKPSLNQQEEEVANRVNDSIDNAIRSLETKYPLCRLWTNKIEFMPADKEQRLQKKGYDQDFNALVKAYIRPYNYKTGRGQSVFITDNLPKDRLDCDTKTALAFSTMKKNIEDMLTAAN